jgi:hypothetical protein
MNNKSISYLLNLAREKCNKYIRERDKYKGCISCGGKVEQAGHYYKAELFSTLKFNEININGQCNECNCGKEGNLIKYREGLINRYGREEVIKLDHEADRCRKLRFKWDKQELIDIINYYIEK